MSTLAVLPKPIKPRESTLTYCEAINWLKDTGLQVTDKNYKGSYGEGTLLADHMMIMLVERQPGSVYVKAKLLCHTSPDGQEELYRNIETGLYGIRKVHLTQ